MGGLTPEMLAKLSQGVSGIGQGAFAGQQVGIQREERQETRQFQAGLAGFRQAQPGETPAFIAGETGFIERPLSEAEQLKATLNLKKLQASIKDIEGKPGRAQIKAARSEISKGLTQFRKDTNNFTNLSEKEQSFLKSQFKILGLDPRFTDKPADNFLWIMLKNL